MQRNAHQLFIQTAEGKSFYLHTNIAVTDFCLNRHHVVVTNERQLSVYRVTINAISATATNLDESNNRGGGGVSGGASNLSLTAMLTFAGEALQLFIYEENILALGHGDVKIYSFGGVMLRQLHFNDTEGNYA